MRTAEEQRRHRQAAGRRVERVLDAHDLGGGPRELSRLGGDEPVEHLAAACGELGGTFAAFAAYLATRTDLLSAPDCRTLDAAAPGAGDGASADEVDELLAAELGAPRRELFATWEPAPRAARWPLREHRATAADGSPVHVCLVVPGAEERAAAELDLLPLLTAALRRAGVPADDVFDGFRRALSSSFDLAAAAGALAALQGEADRPPELGLLPLRPELCSARVLTTAAPEGETAREVAGRPTAQVIARRTAVAWLSLALDSAAYPLSLDDLAVIALPGGRVAFAAVEWARPPAVLREPLERYLDAARRHDPDSACAALLEVLEPLRPGADGEGLLVAVRQAVPFRDGAWSERGDSLPEHLFLHWRAARRCGFAPRAGLADFQRGLTAAAAVLRRLDPAGDPLAAALDDLTLRRTAAGLQRVLAPSRLNEEAERFASLMAGLPERLDAALRRAAEGPPDAAPRRRRQRRGGDRVALLLTFAAAATAALLLVRELGAAGWPAVEPLAVGVVLLLGGLVLRGLEGGGR